MTRAGAIRVALSVAVCAITALAAVHIAGAATANGTAAGGGFPGAIDFEAADGEANMLTVRRSPTIAESAPDTDATSIELADLPGRGILITPQGTCTAPDGSATPTYRVLCPVSNGTIRLEMGDGNDQVTGHTVFMSWAVLGEGGADTISSGWADDVLSGGSANDTLLGDRGNDDLRGGDGFDVLSDDEGDNNYSGGSGNDSIVDGDGDSDIDGGGGGDKITDQGGRDGIVGGRGNDVISADDGDRDSINCGAGSRDRANVDRSDRVADSCEQIRR